MYICLSLAITAAAEAIPLEEVNEPVTIIVNTMSEDDDACTDVVPAPEAEGACVLAVSSQQEEREHLWQPLLRHAKSGNMHAEVESQLCV